jgi:hypothetical protein
MFSYFTVYPTPGHGKNIGQILLLDNLRCVAQIDVTPKVQRLLEDFPRLDVVGCQIVINPYNPTSKVQKGNPSNYFLSSLY